LQLDHGSDVPVFENQALLLLCFSKHNIHHCPGQVISANDLIRKQQSKHGIDRTYQPVTEVRFLSGLHWVDVRRAEKINVRKPGREQRPLGLSFVACEGKPASSCRVSTIPAQERKSGVRTAVTENSRELNRVAGGYGAKFRV
jgi:hypothetical protein